MDDPLEGWKIFSFSLKAGGNPPVYFLRYACRCVHIKPQAKSFVNENLGISEKVQEPLITLIGADSTD